MKPYHILLRDLMKQTDNMIRSLQDYKEEIQEEYDDYCKQKQEQRKIIEEIRQIGLCDSYFNHNEK